MQLCPPDCLQIPAPEYKLARESTGASRIADLLEKLPPEQRRFDAAEVGDFFKGRVGESSTCFENVRRTFSIPVPKDSGRAPSDLKAALAETLEGSLQLPELPIIALSGGVDSLLLAGLVKEILGYAPRAATLISNLPGYCERETTLRMADQLGLTEIETVEVTEKDFVADLPSVISACEVPLYNLHPVSKWLFARELKKRGYRSCITGDGADQVASGKIAYDYLPLLSPLFQDHGIAHICPFLAPEVITAIRQNGDDPDKREIRNLAGKYLPSDFARKEKRACFAPPMNLEQHRDNRTFTQLPAESGFPTGEELSDYERTFWTTLRLLERSHLS